MYIWNGCNLRNLRSIPGQRTLAGGRKNVQNYLSKWSIGRRQNGAIFVDRERVRNVRFSTTKVWNGERRSESKKISEEFRLDDGAGYANDMAAKWGYRAYWDGCGHCGDRDNAVVGSDSDCYGLGAVGIPFRGIDGGWTAMEGDFVQFCAESDGCGAGAGGSAIGSEFAAERTETDFATDRSGGSA